MMSKNTATAFASAERAETEKLTAQSKSFEKNEVLNKIANAISRMLLVLNHERQIVYANRLFLDFLGVESLHEVIGKRPGEAVNCIHANAAHSGCGTSEFCKTCGAVHAILDSHHGKASEKECRITTLDSDALDLRVTATPYIQNGQEFTIFAMADISNEKRRQMLERVFFHDVLNSASAISGISLILQEINDPDEIVNMAQMLKRSTDILIDEIVSQRTLSAAERGDIELSFSEIGSLDVLKDLMQMYQKMEISNSKKLKIKSRSDNTGIVTDPVLLRRILGNMIKNALEASMPEGTVTLETYKKNGEVVFSVHNSNYMDREIQLQLFKRSFTTKGVGRGIGTYSMKLFGEKYLKGKVWFESTVEDGTRFFLALPVTHPDAD